MTVETRAFDPRIIQGSLTRVATTLEARGMPKDEVAIKVKELAEKCGCDYASPMPWSPLGGAISFDEADVILEGREWMAFYDDLSWKLRSIIENILADADMDPGQISDAIAQAASDFEGRVAAFREAEGIETADDETEEEYDAAAVAALLGMRGAKAGKRIAAPKLADLQQIAKTANDLARWGGYINDEDLNQAQHELEQAQADGYSINADGEADRLESTNAKGLLRFLPRFGSKAGAVAPAATGPGRSSVPAADFAGPHNTLPIVKPKDVANAAVRMNSVKGGDTAAMKARIISIAKRKGASFAAQLPKAWSSDAGSKEQGGTFRAFKSTDGSWRWLAVYSNNFVDKTGETFPAASHKDFVGWVDQTQRFPELWDWHVPLRMGKADLVDYDAEAGMAVAAGYFYAGKETEAENLAVMGDLGVSHGYEYGEKDLQTDGTYRRYRTFEISPLPRARAANEVTLFLPELRQEDLMLTAEKRDHLVKVHGEKAVATLEAQMLAASKDMKSLGVSFKDFAPEDDPAHAPAAAAASGSSVPSVAGAAGAKEEPAADNGAALALAQVVTAAVNAAMEPHIERLTGIESAVKELGQSDTERLAARMLRPRAADIMGVETPSNSQANLVSGPRGGVNSGAKAMGLDDAVKEAQRQAGFKEDGVADNVPDELRWYAGLGVMGGSVMAGTP